MKTKRRRAALLELIGLGTHQVEELGARLGVSPSTIRRDLALLSENGEVARTYGGAIPARPKDEQALGERERMAQPEKQAIARHVAGFITDGDTVILDAGSTTAWAARALKGRTSLRVITNSLPVLQILADAPGIELIALGGAYRPLSQGTFGPLAEAALDRLTADHAFLGADGVVAGRGLCEASVEQASLKHLMCRQAANIFVLADASKLGSARSHAWTPLGRPWTLVTDAGATGDKLAPFRADRSVRIVIAPA